jgi:putative endonuclease
VFCEVKLRKSDTYGAPEYAVTPRKQAQIRRVALGYLADHSVRDTVCRFDVVAIERRGSRTDIRHLRNAF